MSFFKNNYYTPKETSEKLGVHFQTLRNWEKEGKIDCIRSPGGKRFYDLSGFLKKYNNNITINEEILLRKKICYCRVSSNSQKIELDNQIKYMKKKYPDYELLYDIGSGINFNRTYFLKNDISKISNKYKTPIHILDKAVALACSSFKSAITNLKKSNISNFII